MRKYGQKWSSFAAISALLFALPLAHADEEFVVNAPEAKPAKQPNKPKDDDAPSALRLWDGSFDRAADATREVEKHKDIKVSDESCPSQPADLNLGWTEPEIQKYRACEKAKKALKVMSAEAGSIRKEQRVMANVSRVSDVVAVGSVTATLGSQLFMKDETQGASLNKVANIQEVAGYASYATGATDFSLGAYAYLSQKKRLEDVKKNLGSSISSNPQIQADLENSIEKTKSAAYSHMLYGAGKAAVGFVSMKMAKSNREQAEKLKSLPAPVPVAMLPDNLGGGPAFSYPSNGASFTVADGSNSGSSLLTNTAPVSSGASSGTGSSVLPEGKRNLASNEKGGLSDAAKPAGSSPAKAPDGGAASASAEEDAPKDATKEALGGFEVALGGGGAPRYSGSTKSATTEENSILGVFGMLTKNGDESPKSVATGINPNQLYEDATAEQGEGSSQKNGSEASLFDLIKAKHLKMLGAGRLQRPGEVQIKN